MNVDEIKKSTAAAEDLSPVKRALLEIRDLRERLSHVQAASREPVAIVGIGIRTPGGVSSLEEFGELLWSGTDAITKIPPDRWNADDWYDEDQQAPGKMYTREGGFLANVDAFDAAFFGIAPVEAASMDPQQRLVLELAWEALESAGHAPGSLAGDRTGIYLGIANGDYGRALFAHPELIDPYFSQGNAFSVASGRLAYLLGVHGPAMSIDTACSSSLVAVHLACQALRSGECDRALAGGVNLILTPEVNVNFSKAGMMARDGRCKTFDAAADGYVRGEGGAMVVLRRLRDAQADGDNILAVIRGSAVNQDGRSNGLTAPNGPAQEAVIRAALRAADLRPSQIGYAEAHGTGTSLGDPIEVNALGAVLAEGRDAADPVLLGSVKTNIGHLEAAAGIVGLAKAVLALQRGEIPPHLHFSKPNPFIDWASLPVAVAVKRQAWSPRDGVRRAGVSSFGFSGTNAHVLLEQAPVAATAAASACPLQMLVISANDAKALEALVDRHLARLQLLGPDAVALADYCRTASAGRSHLAHRVSVQSAAASGMTLALSAWRRGEAAESVVAGVAAARTPRVAFLFPGQGPQYLGMGRELYAVSPAFRAAFEECAAALDPLLPTTLAEVVFGSDSQLLDQTQFAQPAMFAIEVALAALWRTWGIEPAAVMGHSFGEYAAACVAGALSGADGARMVDARPRLTQALPPGGSMAVLEADGDAVLEAIRSSGRTDVTVAAFNGTSNTVISGARESVDVVAAQFAARGARIKALRVSKAFHSPLVDPVLDEFQAEVAQIGFTAPALTLVSSLTGKPAGAGQLGESRYWRDHLRQPVQFAEAMRSLAQLGITHFIELSPQPVLLGMGAELVADAQWLPSLREGQGAWQVTFDSLQHLYVSGLQPAWASIPDEQPRRRMSLPTYPFQRQRHWHEAVGRPHVAPLPASQRWARVVRALGDQADRGPLDLNAGSYPAKWDCLARLTLAHAVFTLREAGLFARASERHDLDGVLAHACIKPTYRHLVQRWLDHMVHAGLLQKDGSAFVASAPLADPQMARLWSQAQALFTDNQPLFDYVRHCGALVGKVLRGEESPLETLFPGGSPDLARGLYERSATMRYINGLAAAVFGTLGDLVPAGRTLRVMEVGAGTGGTTSALLPTLDAERTSYLFTDVSELFLDRARERFADYGFVDYGLYDLERSPKQQGYAPGSFDVIVSANCVHASTDLRRALQDLRSMLAPGGLLVLVESTVHMAWFDMTTGLIEGWQHFADDLRDDNPLLPPDVWTQALRDAGFAEAVSAPGDASVAHHLGQHVIVARVPGEAAAELAISARSQDRAVAASAGQASVADAGNALREQLQAALPDERIDLLRDFVRAQVVRILKLGGEQMPDRHARLMDLGFDSLMAVQLRNQLAKGVGLPRALPATLMFDQPTIEAIAAYLLGQLGETAAATQPARAVAEATPRVDELAVSQMSDSDIEKLLMERDS